MTMHSGNGRQGSAKTAAIAVVALLAIAFSIFSLTRYKESRVHPRDRIQEFFKCGGCDNLFGLKLVELQELLSERPDDISVQGNVVLVRCPKCGDMAEITVKCPECGKYFVPDEDDEDHVCPFCGP